MNNKIFWWFGVLAALILLPGCGRSMAVDPLPEAGQPGLPQLVVEEHAVCSASVDSPGHFEFSQRIPENVLAHREDWRVPQQMRLETTNAVLEPFGFAVRAHPEDPAYSYQVLQGEEVLVERATHFWTATVRADGTDFAFPVENDHGRRLLVSKGGVEPLEDVYAISTMPVYAGNELVRAEVHGSRVVIMRGTEAIFSIRVKEDMSVSSPLKGFWPWQGGWALEVPHEVFVNGESLNRKYGFDQVFHWRLLEGEPFFFFVENRRDGQVGMAYAGQIMNQRYDEVVHYRCCEPAAFNANSSGRMIWFYALRDGTWYYVEAGLFADE